MTAIAKLMRLDLAAWDRMDRIGTTASGIATAVGSFAFFAFDRFGFQAFIAPRAATRMLLVGLYGWLGLSLAAWLIARFGNLSDAELGEVARMYGYAHLPLLILSFAIQLFAVTLQLLGPSLVVALFVAAVWLPLSLLSATRYVFGAAARSALLIVGVPYLVWLALVGGYLWRQIGHLL